MLCSCAIKARYAARRMVGKVHGPGTAGHRPRQSLQSYPDAYPPNAQAVQDCIHLWNDQDQASVHALTHSTNAVIIQLARFTRRSGGRYRKYTGSIPEMQNILMPVFTDELQTQWVPFTLCAGIIHIGRSPFSGHYRAFLLSDETSSGVGSREPHPDQYANAFITDDWIPAEALMTWIGLSFNIMLTCCGMFVLPDVCVADSCAV